MKNKKAPLAVAVFITLIYLVCALSVYLLPDISKIVFGSWFHGVNLNSVWDPTFDLVSFITGLVSSFISGYIGAWTFIKVYGYIAK